MQHLVKRSTTTIAALVAACALALSFGLLHAAPAYAQEAADGSAEALTPGTLEAQSATSGKLYGATWELSAVPGSNPYSRLTISPDPDVLYMGMVAPENGFCTGSDGYGWATSVNAGNNASNCPPWYGHRDDITDVVIESGITRIGSYAFDQCANLRHVEIPSTVKVIGTGAFLGCELPELELPDGVERIGNWAFQGCEFEEITIPASVKSLGARALVTYKKGSKGGSLKTITFEGDAPAVSADDDMISFYSGNDPFLLTEATAYYPAFNDTWTDDAKMELAEEAPIKWIPRNSDGSRNRVDVKDACTIELAQTSYTYNGKVRKPAVTVWSLNYKLKANEYKVTYKNNKNAGKATVTVTGKGDFFSSKKITFKIKKAKNNLTAATNAKTFNVSYKKLKKANRTLSRAKVFDVNKGIGKITYAKVSGKSKIVVSKAGKITVKKGLYKGTYNVKVKVTAAGSANYKALSKTLSFKVRVK